MFKSNGHGRAGRRGGPGQTPITAGAGGAGKSHGHIDFARRGVCGGAADDEGVTGSGAPLGQRSCETDSASVVPSCSRDGLFTLFEQY